MERKREKSRKKINPDFDGERESERGRIDDRVLNGIKYFMVT